MAKLQAPHSMNPPDEGTSEAFGILVTAAVGVTAAVLLFLAVLAVMQEWGVRW